MTASSDSEREDRALDALIVAAFRQEQDADVPPPDLTEPEPVLSVEDQRALDALGPDLVERILSGTRKKKSRPPRKRRRQAPRGKRTLQGSLHRSEETEVTEQARQEMERKVRELDAEEEGGSRDRISDRADGRERPGGP